MIFTRNAAMWLGVLGALLALAVGFGLKISGVQVDLIMVFAGALIPLLTGVATKTQVYSAESAQVALDSRPGTNLAELDAKLAKQN